MHLCISRFSLFHPEIVLSYKFNNLRLNKVAEAEVQHIHEFSYRFSEHWKIAHLKDERHPEIGKDRENQKEKFH